MGNYIYAISANGITATNLTTMENSASIQLEYQNPYESYYRFVEEGPVESEEEDRGESEAEAERESSDDDGATPVRD